MAICCTNECSFTACWHRFKGVEAAPTDSQYRSTGSIDGFLQAKQRQARPMIQGKIIPNEALDRTL